MAVKECFESFFMNALLDRINGNITGVNDHDVRSFCAKM